MGSWYPIFRHNHHGSPAASSQLPDTIMPGERAAHPAPTLVMKDPGRLGSTQYGWCHSKRPELPAMSRAIVLQCFFFRLLILIWSEMARTPNRHLGLPKNKVPPKSSEDFHAKNRHLIQIKQKPVGILNFQVQVIICQTTVFFWSFLILPCQRSSEYRRSRHIFRIYQ